MLRSARFHVHNLYLKRLLQQKLILGVLEGCLFWPGQWLGLMGAGREGN